MDKKIRANFYIDGNFIYHIHLYSTKHVEVTIDWDELQHFLQNKISEEENKPCVIKSQFFVRTETKSSAEEREFLFNSMEHAGIKKNATHLKRNNSGKLKEDGVDTNLVFRATKDYYENSEQQYDYFILCAGDSDFLPLIKGLKNEAVKICLIYWNCNDDELGVTKTSKELFKNSDIQINLEDLLSNEKLFKRHINVDLVNKTA